MGQEYKISVRIFLHHIILFYSATALRSTQAERNAKTFSESVGKSYYTSFHP